MVADKREFVRLDVGYLDNPKIADALEASPLAVILHICSMTHCRQHRTDGVFTVKRLLRKVGATAADARILFKTGLWHDLGGGKAELHDYLNHQESAEQIAARSEAATKAIRTRWDRSRSTSGTTPGNTERISERNTEERRGEKKKTSSSSAHAEPPNDAPMPEFLNGGAVLASHGMPKTEIPEFVRSLTDRGIRNWTAFVSSAHHKGTLDGTIDDWRTGNDATRVTPIRKGPNVGNQDWLLR